MLVFLRNFSSFCSCATFFWNRPHFDLMKFYNITAETFRVIREIFTCELLLIKFIATSSRFFFYNSALQQGFRETCSGVPWDFLVFLGEMIFASVCWCVIMKFFRSPYRIQIPSRPVSYTGGWVQIAEQERRTLLLHHSYTMMPMYNSE